MAWYLNCFAPYPMLANAHAFKDKMDHLSKVNGGLFTYPVLQAADILLYDGTHVPVGKDQQQHLEIARDIAHAVNYYYPQLFVVPQASIQEKVLTVPGTDGKKMSKSYGNTINIFLSEKELKKVIMHIQTDSTPLEKPKDPFVCSVFKLYSLLATEEQTKVIKEKYLDPMNSNWLFHKRYLIDLYTVSVKFCINFYFVDYFSLLLNLKTLKVYSICKSDVQFNH